MRLADRIRKVKAAKEETPAEARLVPYCIVEERICSNRAVEATRSDPREVYQHMVRMHTFRLGREAKAAASPGAAPPRRGEGRRCVDSACGRTRFVLIQAEGIEVCEHCGAVQNAASLNGEGFSIRDRQRKREREDNGSLDTFDPDCKRRKGFTRRTEETCQVAAQQREAAEVRLWKVFDHWNGYARLSDGTLKDAFDLCKRSTTGALSAVSLSEVVASLVYPHVEKCVPDEVRIRKSLVSASALPPLRPSTSPARHSCACGARCHTAKEARFHCKFFSAKRRRHHL